MDVFSGITINKLANLYFDGNVSSRTLTFDSGEVKTLGIMQKGSYTFGTEKKELMEIQAGRVEVQLPKSEDWLVFSAGESFEVPAQSEFNIRVIEVADYCCSYLDD